MFVNNFKGNIPAITSIVPQIHRNVLNMDCSNASSTMAPISIQTQPYFNITPKSTYEDDSSINNVQARTQTEYDGTAKTSEQAFRIDCNRTPNSCRWRCGRACCTNMSPPQLIVPKNLTYYCQRHYHPKGGSGGASGRPGEDPNRWRCIALTRLGRQCMKQDYRILHPTHTEDTFRCEDHKNYLRGRTFRRHKKALLVSAHKASLNDISVLKERAPSQDLYVNIPFGTRSKQTIQQCLVFTGQQFDELTEEYTPATKDSIRRVIQDYFEVLQHPEEHDLLKTQAYIGRELNEREKAGIRYKYRDHLAHGCLYLMAPCNRQQQQQLEYLNKKQRPSYSKGCIYIKIGYSSNLRKRIPGFYGCADSLVKSFFDTSSISPDGFRSMGLVCLLEKIIHEIFLEQQEDLNCLCGRVHLEYFRFEWPSNVETSLPTFAEVFDESEKQIRTQVLKWVRVVKGMEILYKQLCSFHEVHMGYKSDY
ncbi:hypothetical protein BX616_010404 [Lobosporangium transversale]|uniref:Bacteriophage T5 Orf172 DNA-binding domain-containing protein n=1 Tax=Lobosporangium transversale TaxID=64571 RepID=A0A1Y2GLM5_9FUNG|nr:hypothetical protein BCR41DRAFT_422420 [Lobosporangium transversale]KAF9912129.1 hypothetical protein BX616_010404 [Lobosporangium transversale]ORZ14916.1 hypothetical protein BCR41DRAFT_422420 [Lobosporangium transversale]|eukprot:XP_021881048.1 hypothetical protein BCR41DRAFT_422420 [Lobosporangium transversale]